MIKLKVKEQRQPPAQKIKAAETGGTEFAVIKQYSEAELRAMEENLIRQHYLSGKQFDFRLDCNGDPAELLRQYDRSSSYIDVPSFKRPEINNS